MGVLDEQRAQSYLTGQIWNREEELRIPSALIFKLVRPKSQGFGAQLMVPAFYPLSSPCNRVDMFFYNVFTSSSDKFYQGSSSEAFSQAIFAQFSGLATSSSYFLELDVGTDRVSYLSLEINKIRKAAAQMNRKYVLFANVWNQSEDQVRTGTLSIQLGSLPSASNGQDSGIYARAIEKFGYLKDEPQWNSSQIGYDGSDRIGGYAFLFDSQSLSGQFIALYSRPFYNYPNQSTPFLVPLDLPIFYH